jgi:hypothetical protein
VCYILSELLTEHLLKERTQINELEPAIQVEFSSLYGFERTKKRDDPYRMGHTVRHTVWPIPLGVQNDVII